MKERLSQQAFAARVRLVVTLLGGVAAVARVSGLSENAVRKYRDGQADPGRTALIALADAAGVTVGWLATGRGPAADDLAAFAERVELVLGLSPEALLSAESA